MKKEENCIVPACVIYPRIDYYPKFLLVNDYHTIYRFIEFGSMVSPRPSIQVRLIPVKYLPHGYYIIFNN